MGKGLAQNSLMGKDSAKHPYALWESKKLKPMLMGKDLAKHPPTPGGGIKVTW